MQLKYVLGQIQSRSTLYMKMSSSPLCHLYLDCHIFTGPYVKININLWHFLALLQWKGHHAVFNKHLYIMISPCLGLTRTAATMFTLSVRLSTTWPSWAAVLPRPRAAHDVISCPHLSQLTATHAYIGTGVSGVYGLNMLPLQINLRQTTKAVCTVHAVRRMWLIYSLSHMLHLNPFSCVINFIISVSRQWLRFHNWKSNIDKN